MHLLQMAKIESRGAPPQYRMYCSCGMWFTESVTVGSDEWIEAQHEFFDHLADLVPEVMVSYGGTD